MFRRRSTFIKPIGSFLLWLSSAFPQEYVSHLTTAEDLLRKGKTVEALANLDRLRSGPQLPPLALFQLGWLFGQARKYQIAIEIFREVPENIPDRLTHDYAVALSYFNVGQYQKTVDILSDAKRRGLTDAKSANLLGVAYAQMGEAEKAYNSLRDGVIEDATDANGYLNLVTLCVDYGNHALAEKIVTRGIDAFPQDRRLFVSRGALRMLGGQAEKARGDFQRAMVLAPRDPDPYFFAALAEYQLGRFADSLAILGNAIRNGLADSDIHYLLAESLVRLKPDHPERAMLELDHAIQLDPRSVPALLLRAKLMMSAGNTTGAIADLERARRFDPESRSVIYSLAKAYQQLGRKQEARTLFDKVQQDSLNNVAEMSKRKLGRILVERPGP